MSFDVGPVRQPMIQSSQRMQNDGGGGNLGYMNQGKKKKDEEEEKKSLLEGDESDVVQLDTNEISFEQMEEDVNFSPAKWFGKIADKMSAAKKNRNPFKNMNN